MLDRVLPRPVAVTEAYEDPAHAVLYRSECEVVRNAVGKRRREFTTVRWCARHALVRLGERAGPVLPDAHGAPRWPAGVVGSMTHCAGYRAAAVARSAAYQVLGIDAEPDEAVPPAVLDMVALPGELRRLSALREADPTVSWDRLLFSAKEAVYKAWHPLTGRPLGFLQADVVLARDGTFTARLPPSPLDVLRGRWTAGRGLLLTAVAVPAYGRSRTA
ncbi:4'-phosphopantetheinyl transferase [Streptomyces sp. NPDC059564]|uniref:4'-phosphopantetheinyl transferase family protein n=1 Tax=Streptomyces sp. NPDC059564 TaxID=3346865 RepID=UPI0036796E6F